LSHQLHLTGGGAGGGGAGGGADHEARVAGSRREVQRSSGLPLLACGLEPRGDPAGLLRGGPGHPGLGEGR